LSTDSKGCSLKLPEIFISSICCDHSEMRGKENKNIMKLFLKYL
jgi:hypothetical protein